MITCRTHQEAGVTVVSPVGSLDETNLSSLEHVLAGTAEHDTVLDLSRVGYLNSQVLSLAVYSWRNATRSGRRFVLAGASAPVRQVLEVSGLDQLIPVADSVETAVHPIAGGRVGDADAPDEATRPLAADDSLAAAAATLSTESIPELFHIRQRLQDCAAGAAATPLARRIEEVLGRLDRIVFERPKNAVEELGHLKVELGEIDALRLSSSMVESAQAAGSAPAGPGQLLVDQEAFLASGLDAELMAEGVAESREHLDRAEESLLNLESSPGDRELLNEIFRGFHSIKGFAGFVGASRIAHLAHVAETLLDHARNGFIQVSGLTADIILQSIDSLRRMLAALVEGRAWSESDADLRVREYLEAHAVVHQSGAHPSTSSRLENNRAQFGEDESAPPPPIVEALAAGIADRSAVVSGGGAARDDAENGSARREAGAERREAGTERREAGAERREAGAERREAGAETSIRVSIERVDHMVNMVGELVIAQAMLHENPDVVASLEANSALHRQVGDVAKITRELQDISMSLRMVPLASTFQRLARVVRDTSRRLGKEIRFETKGEDTEIDRSMVESIVDPLVHMIRNSLDHGIEDPVQRADSGKPPFGTIRIAAEHEGGYVVIRIEDDGRGIDPDRILAKARERDLVSPDQVLSKAEILELLFLPGFSTADAITDLSGRGVGMDVVKTNIERMGGDVRLESRMGHGTIVTVRVPLTMAIIEGMLVQVGPVFYTIPLLAIRESFAVTSRQLTRTADGEEVVRIRERIYPILRLHGFHGIEPRSRLVEDGILILLEHKGTEFCLLVDEIAGQHQAVVKPLSSYLGRVRGVTSCSIMGNGEISLILDIKMLSEAACAAGNKPQNGTKMRTIIGASTGSTTT